MAINKTLKGELTKEIIKLWKSGVTNKTAIAYQIRSDNNLGNIETVRSLVRSVVNKYSGQNKKDNDDSAIVELAAAKAKSFDSKKKRFIVTWAQSETPVHKGMLANVEAYANFIDAGIHVIAGRYKNPTSLGKSKKLKQEENSNAASHWDKSVLEYLDANRQNIHQHLSILSDVKIQPTAITPLTGLNGLTALESCIVGHPQLHMKSLPILDGYPSKTLVTTGAITTANYSDTKAGKKGEFHHTLGFVIVELDGDIFHMRQVQCDSKGDFYDLKFKVKNGIVKKYKEACPAIIFGDLHAPNEDKRAVAASFKIADWSRAEKIIIHDAIDGNSVSHHDLKDPFLMAEKESSGNESLEAELKYMTDWFNDRPQYTFVSIMSNHTAWIDRWVRDVDWRKSSNKGAWLALAAVVAQGLAPKGLMPYILNKDTKNVISLGYSDSYRVGDWELGLHGDKGASGSRGSITQFKNLNTKTIVGHSHTPARELGCIQVGTLTPLRVSYNAGLSSWMHSNALIYPNGKASLIHFTNYKYTTLF